MDERKLLELATEAYLFGYPLVVMDVTREVMTSVPKAGPYFAPINQFRHTPEFRNAQSKQVVSPNADTLYSVAWLDLSFEPMILSVPAIQNRYYVMPLMDAWTNVFASIGTRTNGNAAGHYAIVGPDWQEPLPKELQVVRSPTNLVWIIGRTQTNNPEDYPNVHAIQKQYHLTPFSFWGKPYTPPDNVPVPQKVDRKTPPVEQVAQMHAQTFFRRLCEVMKYNRPAEADCEHVQRFAALGIVPGKDFDSDKLGPKWLDTLEHAVLQAQTMIQTADHSNNSQNWNGWKISLNVGQYGTDYLQRANIAMFALGATLPDDAIYLMNRVDSFGKPYNGQNCYVLRFRKDQLPPVKAFWSVTMYNSKQFFEANPINRHAIGDRDPLQFHADGSLTIYLQHNSPGQDKESNWLPAPPDDFNLMLRLFWPSPEVLQGHWKPPIVEQVK